MNMILKNMSTGKRILSIAAAWFALIVCSGEGFAKSTVVEDIRLLKQDHMFYIDHMSAHSDLVNSYEHALMDNYYNKNYFSVWHQKAPRYTIEEIKSEFEKYARAPGYGKDRKKYDKASVRKLMVKAALDDYPNVGRPAITVRSSNLRILPTASPRFVSLKAADLSQFDTFQVSSIGVNVPIYVSNISKDKQWCLAETDYYFGWIRVRDVAYMDDFSMNAWENGQYIAVLKDKSPIKDKNGYILGKVSLGAIFPKIGEDNERFFLLTAFKNSHKGVRLKRAYIAKEHAVIKPLSLTTFNVARLANELINQPYGWGGGDGKRDCSLMIRDLFAPFGIWLHRNSTEQGRHGGIFINLENLSDQEKRNKISAEAIPYATLIWKKGHIMLYIGNYQGEPLVFHNFWSVKEKQPLGRERRKIVGHAAITTLLPGKDILNNGYQNQELLKNISGMVLLIPRTKTP